MHGSVTSAAEVTDVSRHGLWLLLREEELLLPFEQFRRVRQPLISFHTLSGQLKIIFIGHT